MNFYVDAYLAKNLGDDLFVKILAEAFPMAQFTVNYYGRYSNITFSKQKNILFPQYPLIFRMLNRLRVYDYINDAKRISNQFDGFILLGGSIFREESYWKSVYDQRISIIDAFRKAGKPVFIIGSNFGPVLTQHFVDQYTKLFQLCTDVCFRDSYSYNLFSKLPNVRMERDIVFQYCYPETQKKDNLIGFSVIDPDHVPSIAVKRDAYKRLVSSAIKDYISKGFQCKIFTFCKAEGDEKIAFEIKEMLSENQSKYLEIEMYNGDLESNIKSIGECSVFIASRFHANILGLLSGTRLIPLIYSDKTDNMLKDSLFMGEVIDISAIDQDTKMPEGIYIHTFPMEEYKNSAQRQFDGIKKHIISERRADS